MANLYQRNDSAVWWVQFHEGGEQFRFSTGLTDRDRAARFMSIYLPMLRECRRLGIRCKPSDGLLTIAKRIEVAWIQVERLVEKLRQRGFLSG